MLLDFQGCDIEGGSRGPDNALIFVQSGKGDKRTLALLAGNDPKSDGAMVDLMRKEIPKIKCALVDIFAEAFEQIWASPRPLLIVFSEKGMMSPEGMGLIVVEDTLAAGFFQTRGVL